MAFFGVTVEEIETANKHPNADRLDVCTLKGMSFQFITGRDDYKPGDKVLYFPLDSLIQQDLLKGMGLEGKLAGKQKNRVKTVRLRGLISQGLVADLKLIEFYGEFWGSIDNPEEITKHLKVEKYEPPIESVLGGIHGGNLAGLPCALPHYDIDGADRYVVVAERLMDKKVTITEKLEGTQISITYSKLDNRRYVNTKNHTVLPSEAVPEPPYWVVAAGQMLFTITDDLKDQAQQHVTLYGELIGPGVQKNPYKLKEHRISLFDIRIDDRYINQQRFMDAAPSIYCVPILSRNVLLREWLGGKTIQEASNGISKLAEVKREGIVITPEEEEYCYELQGRLILKQRSPEYLAKSDT